MLATLASGITGKLLNVSLVELRGEAVFRRGAIDMPLAFDDECSSKAEQK